MWCTTIAARASPGAGPGRGSGRSAWRLALRGGGALGAIDVATEDMALDWVPVSRLSVLVEARVAGWSDHVRRVRVVAQPLLALLDLAGADPSRAAKGPHGPARSTHGSWARDRAW